MSGPALWLIGVVATLVAAGLLLVPLPARLSSFLEKIAYWRRDWGRERVRQRHVLLLGYATVAAGVMIVVLVWGLPSLLTEQPPIADAAERHKAITDTRTGLVAIVAAIGAAGGLAFTARTYRLGVENHRLSREVQITDTYSKAVEQLGHDQAPVRLGALYSLVSLAQDNPQRRQTVVDVICAYLRMPYRPPMTAEPDPDSVDALDDDASLADLDVKGPNRDAAQELQVRKTAQRLLSAHLRPSLGTSGRDAQRIEASPEESFWPGITLDLTGANLVGLIPTGLSVVRASFHGAIFARVASFRGSMFSGDVDFGAAIFSGDALFDGATFSGSALFVRTNFSGTAAFRGATFLGATSFRGAKFSVAASFDEGTFERIASFRGASFVRDATFDGANFLGDTSFYGATFSRGASFRRATFSGAARFGRASFRRVARFDGAHILRLDDEELNRRGEDAPRVWPSDFIVRVDTDDSTRGTLVRIRREESSDSGTPPAPARR